MRHCCMCALIQKQLHKCAMMFQLCWTFASLRQAPAESCAAAGACPIHSPPGGHWGA